MMQVKDTGLERIAYLGKSIVLSIAVPLPVKVKLGRLFTTIFALLLRIYQALLRAYPLQQPLKDITTSIFPKETY
jgi:hypothetical protein